MYTLMHTTLINICSDMCESVGIKICKLGKLWPSEQGWGN